MADTAADPHTRLARRLGTADAVVVGLGAMIGAGVFSAIGPAARAAGTGLLAGLVVAGFVAFANATASAQLAAVYPRAGGTYVYGTERLGHVWGYLAGWGFVTGKTASCAAMALTVGAYAAPGHARPVALAVLVGLVAVNLAGVTKAAWLTRVILVVVLGSLAVIVTACLTSGSAARDNLAGVTGHGVHAVLQSAAFLFFAFAGYARIATLGEEVRDPARTIPRAVPIALGLTFAVYALVAVAALATAGAPALAASSSPLATAVRAAGHGGLVPLVRVGASVAAAGVLLSLLLGVSRTAFSMAGAGDLPRPLASVHPRTRVPHVAELCVGVVVVAVVAVADVRGAIGFSSFCVLVYYAIANASSLTLPAEARRWPRVLHVAGLAGCVTLALTLPGASIATGTVVLAVGLAVLGARRALGPGRGR